MPGCHFRQAGGYADPVAGAPDRAGHGVGSIYAVRNISKRAVPLSAPPDGFGTNHREPAPKGQRSAQVDDQTGCERLILFVSRGRGKRHDKDRRIIEDIMRLRTRFGLTAGFETRSGITAPVVEWFGPKVESFQEIAIGWRTEFRCQFCRVDTYVMGVGTNDSGILAQRGPEI